MLSVIRLITWTADLPPAQIEATTQALARAGAAPQVVTQLVNVPQAGGWNAGDLLWHMVFAGPEDLAAWEADHQAEVQGLLDARAAHVDWVRFTHGAGGARQPDMDAGVYRALFLTLEPGATEDQVALFEEDLIGLAAYIPEILNWRRSRVEASGGSAPWTFVWEQEFRAVGDIKGPYVEHPYHWGYVDRWFDPEMPGRIIGTVLCHTFTGAERSLIGVGAAARFA